MGTGCPHPNQTGERRELQPIVILVHFVLKIWQLFPVAAPVSETVCPHRLPTELKIMRSTPAF